MLGIYSVAMFHVGAKSALLRRFFYAHACPRAKSVIRLPLPAFQNRAFLRRPRLESPVLPCEMPSKPVHPLQKEKGPPESVPFSFWSFGRKKSRLRPFHSNALGAQMLWGAPFPLCVFLRRIDSPKAAKKGGRKAAYAAVPAAGRGNIKAPQRRPFPLLRGQAKSRQAPSGGACRLFLFQTDFLFQRAFQTAFQRALTGCVPRAGQGTRAKRGLCLPAHGPSKSLPLSPRINCGPHTGLRAPA